MTTPTLSDSDVDDALLRTSVDNVSRALSFHNITISKLCVRFLLHRAQIWTGLEALLTPDLTSLRFNAHTMSFQMTTAAALAKWFWTEKSF